MTSRFFGYRALGVGLGCVLAVACSTLPELPDAARQGLGSEKRACLDFYLALDRTVGQAGVGDAEYHRVPGFPHLRSSRVLAALIPGRLDQGSWGAWLEQARRLDEQARLIEYRNLPAAARAVLPRERAFAEQLQRCGGLLRDTDVASPGRREHLVEAARVADEYRTLQRVLGLYPLTQIPVAIGIDRWRQEVLESHRTAWGALPVSGRLLRYRPAASAAALSAPQIARRQLQWRRDHPLSLPEPDAASRAALFATFAPVWELDVAHPNDRIGRPYWDRRGALRVDTATPLIYRRLSYARLEGQWLLQLNYVLWFPARTRLGTFDLYGGHLDGITWRVTLGPDGRPWLYDTVHNCGCYHKLYPSPFVSYREELAERLLEPPLVAQAVPPWSADTPLLIRVAQHSHFIQRIEPRDMSLPFSGEQQEYRWADYRELRSLPHPEGRRSLFDARGIVPGTERAERWLLWTMGIPNVGAMRQWGHHATALLGRRHFDDPDGWTALFRRTGP